MKPEYIGGRNFDTNNYAYAYCKCPLPYDYAIKWPLIKDGKEHKYSCICEDCGTEVGVIRTWNLCDSCINGDCIFQSGIVRKHCDFYKGVRNE